MVNQPSRQELDQLLRTQLVAVRTALDNIAELKAVLDTITDSTLTTAGQGYEYSATEKDNIRNAVASLAQLRVVANAGATVGSVDDFFFYAKKVWGFNPVRR